MKIVIISDIHDNVWNLQRLLDHLPETDAMIFCGDLCSPFIISLLANGYSLPIHIVFGNNDGDLFRITGNAARFENVHLYGEFAELKLGGRNIGVSHYPEIARSLVSNSIYDVVCYGHNHEFSIEKQEQTLLLNPGPVMGFNPSTGLDVPASFIIYDTEAHKAAGYQIVENGILSFP